MAVQLTMSKMTILAQLGLNPVTEGRERLLVYRLKLTLSIPQKPDCLSVRKSHFPYLLLPLTWDISSHKHIPVTYIQVPMLGIWLFWLAKLSLHYSYTQTIPVYRLPSHFSLFSFLTFPIFCYLLCLPRGSHSSFDLPQINHLLSTHGVA